MLSTVQVDRLGMAQDERRFEEAAEPKVIRIRQAFAATAAPEAVADCLEAADSVTALLATLPPAEARRFAAYLTDMMAAAIKDRRPPEQ
jgi:hypothetical protein